MTLSLALSLLASGLLGAAATAALADPAPVSVEKKIPALPPVSLYRDTAAYPPLHLTWNPSTNQSDVHNVFPHPQNPHRAALTTGSGVLLTDDGGLTWNPLPGATTDKIGPILDLAFHPFSPDTFYLASETTGIWVTIDAGKTFSQLASKTSGLAADKVVGLIVYPGDSTRQTLLAVHGDAAVGLSRSRDAGKTWEVVNPEYHFFRLISAQGHKPQLYLVGSTLKEPEVKCLYACGTVGEFIAEVMRDIAPTDLALTPPVNQKSAILYLTTSDIGLYRISDDDSYGLSFSNKQLPLKDTDGLASVGVTWGPNADSTLLYVDDPVKLGLVVSNDDFATFQSVSDGLSVSSLVKEGAAIRANANGTVFYSVANDALSIGRQADDVPVVVFSPTAFDVNPLDQTDWRAVSDALGKFAAFKGSTVEAAKALDQAAPKMSELYRRSQLSVTARLPLQPAPPTSVTLDLSRFGGNSDTPLYDDGQHNDGAAGDGLYGGIFAFLPWSHHPKGGTVDWRSSWPGLVALGVTATYADGHRQGAVGVVDVFLQVADIAMWDNAKSVATVLDGGVTAEPFQIAPSGMAPGKTPVYRRDETAVRLNVPKGPWAVHFKAAYNKINISDQAAISFGVSVETGESPKELYLQLQDKPEFSLPTTTDRLEVLGGNVPGHDFQAVVVPISKLLGTASPFQADHFKEIILSGDSAAPATLVIRNLQALADDPTPPTPAPAPAQ